MTDNKGSFSTFVFCVVLFIVVVLALQYYLELLDEECLFKISDFTDVTDYETCKF